MPTAVLQCCNITESNIEAGGVGTGEDISSYSFTTWRLGTPRAGGSPPTCCVAGAGHLDGDISSGSGSGVKC